MEGPTLQQDVALVLGFATTVVTVTSLWAIFSPVVGKTYQTVAKSIYQLLPQSSPVVADNGHDPRKTVFWPKKTTPPATPPPPTDPPTTRTTPTPENTAVVKKVKVVSAVNGPKKSPATSPAQVRSVAAAATSDGASGSGSQNSKTNGSNSKRNSITSTEGARTSPKPARQPAPSA